VTQIHMERFRPAEGALLDLRSLECVAAGPERLLGADLERAWPGGRSLVLDGLEPSGQWSANGPPGTLRPDGLGDTLSVSPGRAVLTDPAGRPFLLTVTERLEARWPTKARAAVSGALVLMPEIAEGSTPGGLSVARELLSAQIGFVRPEQLNSNLLVLARSINNGRDWALDEQRLWQPEHPAVQLLLQRMTAIEHAIWRAEPEGAVWDRQILGRNWVRYQTVAAAALQAVRFQLAARAMNTLERVRLLTELRRQLEKSVEVGATELMQLVGTAEEAGAYLPVHSDPEPR